MRVQRQVKTYARKGILRPTTHTENLVTNGDASNGTTGWTTYGITPVLKEVDGVFVLQCDGDGNEGFGQALAFNDTKTYEVQFQVVAGPLKFLVGDGVGGLEQDSWVVARTNGFFRIEFVASRASTHFSLQGSGVVGRDFAVRNIMIRGVGGIERPDIPTGIVLLEV